MRRVRPAAATHSIMSDESAGPPDPITQLTEGAVQMHELFIAYVSAGFTKYEALVLLGTMLRPPQST
jgi:hypothetical protein